MGKTNHRILLNVLTALLFLLNLTASASANDLSEILSAGTLCFGTSLSYRPFVYYDKSEPAGLDIAIIREIGKRLKLNVHVTDMAFDGLVDSVTIGQVDLIGGAFSKTAEREAELDYTHSYYQNAGLFIAAAGSKVPDSLSPENIRNLSFGVQRGSSFEQWLKTNYVGQGLLQLRNIYAYTDIESTIKGLDNGSIDIVLIDRDVFQSAYASGGKYKVVSSQDITEEYAFAASKGSTALIAAVNEILAAMKNDGTLAKLIDRYINNAATGDESLITISRPSDIILPQASAVKPTATAIPPIHQPANCKNVMVFLSDVSMPDGTKINPGKKFTKTWQVYNNGSCTWYPGYQVVFVGGDYMSGNEAAIPVETIPGRTVDVSIELTAPQKTGVYSGYFQLRAPDGSFFGPTMTTKIIVTDEKVKKTKVGADPVITVWSANKYKGGKEYCPRVKWEVRNCTSVEIYVNHKLAHRTSKCSGSKKLCPPFAKGTYDYGIVGYGANKNASYVFTYTNTGKVKKTTK